MKNKKGFTLVELLAVITLIALLSILIVPSVLNLINRNETKISSTTEKLIFSATESYLEANQTNYIKLSGAVYCPSIQDLIDSGFFTEELIDMETGEKYNSDIIIKSSYNGYKYEYEIKTPENCVENKPDLEKEKIVIDNINYYRDEILEGNRQDEVYYGSTTIVKADIETAKIANGTKLKLAIRRGSNYVRYPNIADDGSGFTNEEIVVENNHAELQFIIPASTKVGDYVIEVIYDNIKATSNFEVIET